jgi:transposase
MAQTRKRYDEDFKRKAVQTLIESGKPVTTIALSLGVEQSILHRWRIKYETECRAKSANGNEQPSAFTEIASLKGELRAIKETIEQLRRVVKKSLRNRYIISPK